jgi:hypothetical protein
MDRLSIQHDSAQHRSTAIGAPTARIGRGIAQLVGGQWAAAAVLAEPAGGSAATTVTTVGQAYYCVFAHCYAGPVLDDRVLLAAAFAGRDQAVHVV